MKIFSTEWLTALWAKASFAAAVSALVGYKFQEKYLLANTTQTSGALTDLTFNNLTIGRKYRARFKMVSKAGDTGQATGSIVHNGVTLDIAFNRGESGSAGAGGSFYAEATFTATATTLTFVISQSSAGRLLYGGSNAYTKSMLEEVPMLNFTTDWT